MEINKGLSEKKEDCVEVFRKSGSYFVGGRKLAEIILCTRDSMCKGPMVHLRIWREAGVADMKRRSMVQDVAEEIEQDPAMRDL